MKTLDVAIKVAVLVCALLVGPGCATIVKGTNQRIPVASEPASADVLVDGTFAGKTPTAVLLKRKNDHLITVKKDGYEAQSVAVVKSVGGAVYGNILAGGLIGWGIDASNGSQYNLFPETISVKLDSVSGTQGTAATGDQVELVAKLKTLDQLHTDRQLSDAEFAAGRAELFRKYLPELNVAEGAGSKGSQVTRTPPMAAGPGAAPSPPPAPVSTIAPGSSHDRFGMSFQPNANGLAIASVEKGSVAQRAGLKAGQIITHANGTELGPKYWEHAQAFIEQAGDQVVMKLYNGATVLLVRD